MSEFGARTCWECGGGEPTYCEACVTRRVREATEYARAERDRLAAKAELLTAGFQPASDALTDEIAKHAETRRERDQLAAEVARLNVWEDKARELGVEVERLKTKIAKDEEYGNVVALGAAYREQVQRAERAEAAGRALAEAAKALRSRLRALSVRMDGRHVYAIQNAPTFYEQVHAIDAALSAWDRAARRRESE